MSSSTSLVTVGCFLDSTLNSQCLYFGSFQALWLCIINVVGPRGCYYLLCSNYSILQYVQKRIAHFLRFRIALNFSAGRTLRPSRHRADQIPHSKNRTAFYFWFEFRERRLCVGYSLREKHKRLNTNQESTFNHSESTLSFWNRSERFQNLIWNRSLESLESFI